MKKTKTLLIIATASLVLMIIIALVMSIVAIKSANTFYTYIIESFIVAVCLVDVVYFNETLHDL